MKTVQLAIRDSEYAQSIRNSLLLDGSHRVFLVDRPDLRLDGVIVVDGSGLENLCLLGQEPERFVVIARKSNESFSQLWKAGIRHVVFEGDSPNTAQLAVIAAELRLPNPGPRAGRSGPEKQCTDPRSTFPILEARHRCAKGRLEHSRRFDYKGF